MCHALPEPPALSLAAAHHKAGCCAWGPPQGAPRTIPLFILPKFLAAHQPGKPDRKQEGDHRTASLASQLRFTCRTPGRPYCKDVCLCWDAQPAPRGGHTNRHAPAEPRRSHLFCPHCWRLLSCGWGSKWPQVRRKALGWRRGWHAMPSAPTRPPPGPPAGGSGARLRRLLPTCPATWPGATSANVLV